MAVHRIDLAPGGAALVNGTVHLAQHRPQNHGQGEQAHHPDFAQAQAAVSRG